MSLRSRDQSGASAETTFMSPSSFNSEIDVIVNPRVDAEVYARRCSSGGGRKCIGFDIWRRENSQNPVAN
jgi:hypothetical protein